MKRIFIIMLVVLMFLAVATVVMAWVKCPVDGFSMYFTGSTRVDFGHLMKEYKCPVGHTYWFKL